MLLGGRFAPHFHRAWIRWFITKCQTFCYVLKYSCSFFLYYFLFLISANWISIFSCTPLLCVTSKTQIEIMLNNLRDSFLYVNCLKLKKMERITSDKPFSTVIFLSDVDRARYTHSRDLWQPLYKLYNLACTSLFTQQMNKIYKWPFKQMKQTSL